MAVTTSLAEAPQDRVKREIGTTLLTSRATLNLLRALLGLNLVYDNPEKQSSARKVAVSKTLERPVPSSTKQKPRRPKGRDAADFTIFETPQTVPCALNGDAKRKLATETFNTTLKHLSDAAKARSAPQGAHEERAAVNTSPGHPLQNYSPNRKSKPSIKCKMSKTAGVSQVEGSNDWESIAECAATSLDYLRMLEQSSYGEHKSKTDWRLERGSLIMLDKFITLKLKKHACEEAVKEKLHFEKMASGSQATEGLSSKWSIPDMRDENFLSVALLVDFGFEDKTLFSLITSFHSQVLRVALLFGRAIINDAMLAALRPTEPLGPPGVILKGMKQGLISPSQAVQQLRTVSQAIMTLCASVDENGSDLASPEAVFELRCIALDIRCRAWNLLPQESQPQRELWLHFGRALSRYRDDCKTKCSEDYQMVKDALQSLQKTDCLNNAQGNLPPSITSALVEMAQRAGCVSDSLSLLEKQSHCVEKETGMSLLLLRCKIAFLRLSSWKDDRNASLASAEQVLELLKGSLKGSACEMNDLLLFGARLRKAALGVATDVEELITRRTADQVDSVLQLCAIRLVFAFLHFVLRYLSSSPFDGGDSVSSLKQPEHNEALRSVSYKTIDAVLTAGKCANAWTADIASETDTAVQKCIAVAKLLEGRFLQDGASITPDPSHHSLFVRISNTYWYRYLEHKDDAMTSPDPSLMLERSVEVLANRAVEEQDQGCLPFKYLKLCSLYVAMKCFKKARQTQRRAIALVISSGALAEAVELALSKPMLHVWSDQSSKPGILGKILSEFVNLSSTHAIATENDDLIWDDNSLPAIHRAVLLEKQILAFETIATSCFTSRIIAASREILDIYNSHLFRVCRLRFASTLLKISSINDQFPISAILGDTINSIICDEDADSSATPFLHSYAHVLIASVQIHLFLQASQPDAETIHRLLVKLRTHLNACSDTTSFENVVEDPHALIRLLQSLADYAGMLDLKPVKLAALRALRVILEFGSRDSANLVSCLTSIGTLQAQTGDTVNAGRSFAAAEKNLSKPNVAASTIIEWELAYAGYLLEISNTKRCYEAFQSAGRKFDVEVSQSQPFLSRSRSRQELLAQGAYVASKLAFSLGDVEAAILSGRQCIKLSTGIWMSLEKLWNSAQESDTSESQDHNQHSLTDGISNLSFSFDSSVSRAVLNGAPFWQHVDLHFRALLHVSSLCAHSGLYQDSLYYAEQANKVGLSTRSSCLVAKAQSFLFALYSRASQLDLATKSSQALKSQISAVADETECCRLLLSQSSSWLAIGELDMARHSLEKAEMTLSKVQSDPAVDVVIEASNDELELVSGIAAININNPTLSKPIRKPPTQQAAIRGRPVKTGNPPKHAAKRPTHQDLMDIIVLIKTRISLLTGDLTSAISHLSACTKATSSVQSTEYRLLEASVMLSQAMQVFAVDPVHCVIAETAIGLPSRHREGFSTGNDRADQEARPYLAAPTEGRKIAVKTPQRKVKPEASISKSYDFLTGALASLLEANSPWVPENSSDVIHQVHKTLSQLTLLTSAISLRVSCSPVQFICRSLIPMDIVRRRELWTLNAEITTSDRLQVQSWPVVSSGQEKPSNVLGSNSISAIQESVLHSLPSSWTVVSFSLSVDKSELVISKVSAEEPPFVLCIPLLRSSSDDLDERAFSFDDAKKELVEIISQANLTAHDARGQAEKAARKVWWAERQTLDRRLGALLQNMENIWLGGFRGILAQTRVDQKLLTRFAESLCQSLDKHLPSRKKPGTKSKMKVQLHAHIMELFLALGHPDENELDDCITDLLYFVVDILQFSGERNAYDEIDFDMIIVEVLDALRSYHEAYSPMDDEERHTILILQKELHAFPWESLPCLSGQSISRMPSMGELHERLKNIREQDEDGQYFRIPSHSGSYILNPSSDLTSTQNTFESTFKLQLANFTSIISRIPAEEEFESCLRDNALFLYFGHGSGAQYIRGRTIKKLRQCAVTFLMGCSSSKMVDCGVYEPYGVPWNYMFARAPAVVGTLWDVTDKDIDRFAMKTFTNWGLVDADMVDEGRKSKEMSGKSKTRAEVRQAEAAPLSERLGRMALDEAVARARDSCVLRYLNGAAPVIYGVPVVLNKGT